MNADVKQIHGAPTVTIRRFIAAGHIRCSLDCMSMLMTVISGLNLALGESTVAIGYTIRMSNPAGPNLSEPARFRSYWCMRLKHIRTHVERTMYH
jgi:hypothetical protein